MTPAEIVDEFLARIGAKDLDRACELVTNDCEYDNVPMGKQFGPEGIKALLGPMVDSLDDVAFVVHRQAVGGNVVMNERTDSFRKDGRALDLPVAGVFEVTDEGRISLWRDYFDLPTFNEQLSSFLA